MRRISSILTASALLCAGTLLLTGCSVQENHLDALQRQLDYTHAAGKVSTTQKTNGLDTHTRVYDYDSPAAYPVLKKRLQKLGYTCTDIGDANLVDSLCEDASGEIAVRLGHDKAGTILSMSIP